MREGAERRDAGDAVRRRRTRRRESGGLTALLTLLVV